MLTALPVALAALAAPVQPAGIRWTVIDLTDAKTYSQIHPATLLSRGGQREMAIGSTGTRMTVRYQPSRDAVKIAVYITAAGGNPDRGLTVRADFLLPGRADEWAWWHDLDTIQPLTDRPAANLAALRGLPGLPYFPTAEPPGVGRYSVYPLGAVSRGEQWVAVGRRMSELIVARFAAIGGASPALRAEVDLALTANSKRPHQAHFTLVFLRGSGPGAGMRAALAKLYDLWPEDWQVRAKTFGGWMPFTDLAKIPNVDEFGFAYQEGARSPGFVDRLGALSFVYFHCAGEFANVDGYKRGTKPLPPYEKVVAAFNRVAKQRTGIDGVWDLCGIRGPDGRIAYRPERVYGDFFCQACVDPDLPYGRAIADKLIARVTKTKFPEGIDGVYYDGIAAGLDYAPAHLKAADHLLLWDAERRRPVNYNLFSSVEWTAYIHRRFAGTGKLTMQNDGSLSSFAFSVPYIDVPGGEMSINLLRRQARLIRAYTSRKPFCTLVKADFAKLTSAQIETYMRRCLAYGILFGFFDIAPSGAHPGSSYWLHPEWHDRDRPLFRRYMPLARELARAGWQPVAGAATNADGVFVERFGPGPNGLTYLTVSTDPGPDPSAGRSVSVDLDPAVISVPRDALAVELLTGRIERAGRRLTMTLRGDDLAVWALGSSAAHARACLDRARDILVRRRRYIEACRSIGTSLAPWRAVGEGGAAIVSPGRGGSGRCLKVVAEKPGQYVGAVQTVVLNHDRPRPIVVSGWSKAQGVTGPRDRDYSIYVDIYYTDGSPLYGNTITFDTGTHDWQFGQIRIEPKKPIKLVNVYLLMRGKHAGTAWFDDIKVALADAPQKNLLPRGDFEADSTRPLAGDSEQARAINQRMNELERMVAGGAVDYARAERLLSEVAGLARQAAWGADTDRTLRDVQDLRWHLALAQACAAGKPQPAQRPSRLMEHVALGRARRAATSGVRQYTAQRGKVPPGTKIIVDSLYPQYSARPLTDGKINPTGAHWTEIAWASAEAETPHWIELVLPRPMRVSEVRIWWAHDAGQTWISRKVVLQTRADGDWRTVEGQQVSVDRGRGLTTIRLPDRPSLRDIRIYQPRYAGPETRPDIMWVSEVEIDAR